MRRYQKIVCPIFLAKNANCKAPAMYLMEQGQVPFCETHAQPLLNLLSFVAISPSKHVPCKNHANAHVLASMCCTTCDCWLCDACGYAHVKHELKSVPFKMEQVQIMKQKLQEAAQLLPNEELVQETMKQLVSTLKEMQEVQN